MKCRWRVVLTVVLSSVWSPMVYGIEKTVPGGPLDTRVYLFRGVVGYWPDADGMAARMANRGYCPYVYCSRDVPRLTAALVAEQEQGACGPIHLIGYSYGASAAVRMARDLKDHGITVDRLVLIECYDYPVIPTNVRYCVNVYESRRLDRLTLFRGTVATADPSQTELIDIDIAIEPDWEPLRANNHFNMADDPRIQEFVASQFPVPTVESKQFVTGEIAAGGSDPFRPLSSVVPTTPRSYIAGQHPTGQDPTGAYAESTVVPSMPLQNRGRPSQASASPYRTTQLESYPMPRQSAYGSYRVPAAR